MNKNNRRKAFTLMELLLVVALVSVVAAIASSAFYMNAGEKLTQARIGMLKSRYTEIRTALDLQLKDEVVLDSSYHVAAAPGAVSRLQKLVESGHLQPGAMQFEKTDGQTAFFKIDIGNSAVEEKLPPILRTTSLHVMVSRSSGDYDLDAALKIDNKTWRQIWEEINQ